MRCLICESRPAYYRKWLGLEVCEQCYQMLEERERLKQQDAERMHK